MVVIEYDNLTNTERFIITSYENRLHSLKVNDFTKTYPIGYLIIEFAKNEKIPDNFEDYLKKFNYILSIPDNFDDLRKKLDLFLQLIEDISNQHPYYLASKEYLISEYTLFLISMTDLFSSNNISQNKKTQSKEKVGIVKNEISKISTRITKYLCSLSNSFGLCKEAFEVIYGDCNTLLNDLDKYQRLYLLSMNYPIKSTTNYIIRSNEQINFTNNNDISINDLAKKVKEYNFEPIECLIEDISFDKECSVVYNICSNEIFKMVRNNINVKKCKICNDYFILNAVRVDTIYCEKCRESGAQKAYKMKIESNDFLKLYNREYQRRYAKIRNIKGELKDIKKKELRNWVNQTKLKMSEPNLSIQDFKNWLQKE